MRSLLTAHRWPALLASFCLAVAFGGCAEDASPTDETDPGTEPGPTGPPSGETDFVSADGREGQDSGESNAEDEFGAGADADDGGAERTVEEGDIYRVLGDGLLLNLNSYRGLQVLDLNDPTEPTILGRAQISGYPVEMYVVGERAYILMNNWRGYYGWDEGDEDSLADSARVEQRYGGVVAVADISDPANPQLLQHAFVPGNISTSRLTRQGDAAALYVAAAGYGQFEGEDGELVWDTRTYVRSFDLAGGGLEQVSERDLGGYVSDIQATPNTLLVARWNWEWQSDERGSELSLFDISDPSGVMVAGDDIRVSGQIENKFNMDIRDGILRVVSANSWRSEANTNFVQTFDASDLSNVTLLDEATFGDNEDLYATLFLENAGFFVTYRRVDPFHAFEIRDDGTLIERSEFIVSGWNDYFRPAFDQTRLIGIGVNDEDNRTMAVSLYDITDLDNPEPLITRSEVDASRSWSEASWDDRAFSVLEGAVEVYADDGTLETGLVLLPYTGYDTDWSDYTAAVQIFTFSDTTLTRRGIMEHGTPVRRSFPAHDATANLSEAELSLFDTADPDAPAELGRVELAPNYTDYFTFGDYGVRIKNRSQDYYWVGDRTNLPPTLVEIVAGAAHPDEAEAIATIELPASANMFQVGDLLVAMTRTVTSWDEYPYETETDLRVIDLSDPTSPRAAGSIVTDALPWGDSYYGWGWDDCWDCGWGYYGYGSTGIEALESGLVIPVQRHENEIVGSEYTCRTNAVESEYCWGDSGEWREDCVTYSGGITCTSIDGGPTVCTGELYECSYDDGSYDCDPIAEDAVETETNCYENDRYRYWSEMDYHFVDLRDADAPAVGDTVALGAGNEFVSTLVDGDTVYANYRVPVGIGDDGRSYVRYFARAYDASNPSDVADTGAINVPGELIAIDGDQIYTRDFVYGEEIIESSLARLTLYEGRAYLQGRYDFPNQRVSAMLVDGDDRLFVSHQRSYSWWLDDDADDDDWSSKLTVLDLSDGGLDVASTVTIDDWATLQSARDGRALFQIPGGLLVVDAFDPATPYAAAWYPTRGWPRTFTLVGDDVVFAAGRYGLYRLPFDAYNLLPPL